MRFVTLLALLASSTVLSGCVTGGDGSALSLAALGSVCGVNAGNCATPSTTTPTTVPTPVTPAAPPPNIGSTTTLATGDTTIALESGKLVSAKTDPAYSKLTIDNTANTAKFEIDPKSPNKALWPVAKTMTEYKFGSCDSLWSYPASTAYSNCLNGAGGGTGLGGNYKEYRVLSNSTAGVAADEELQVWTWNYSYGTQYRNITTSGEATQQAWSAGGTKTDSALIPSIGTAHYTGQFGAVATTSGWIDPQGSIQTLSHNNTWRVIGGSDLTANFATGIFTGTLTPWYWNSFQTMNGATGFQDVDLFMPSTYLPGDPQGPAIDLNNANYAYYMSQDVLLKGTITNSATAKNQITGTAELDPNGGFISNTTDNPMYANFYGPVGNEVTGVFNLGAILPAPIGGTMPIIKDKRGFIEMSGVFNGQ
jgi:hypothetical protein